MDGVDGAGGEVTRLPVLSVSRTLLILTMYFNSFDSAREAVDELSEREDPDPPDRLGTGRANVMLSDVDDDDDDDAVGL